MGSPKISAYNISFSHSAQPLLREVSFQLHSGQKIALVGPNGCGKTSLLRILNAELDVGTAITIRASTCLVAQHTEDLHVSGGEARVEALERAFSSGCDVLLLDEPTNDLDANAREWFAESLDRFPGTVVLVSHDPAVLDAVDEIWELRHGMLTAHPPGFQNFVNRIAREESALEAKISGLRSELKARQRKTREVIARQEKRATRGEKQGKKANLPRILQGARKRQAENTLGRIRTIQEDRTDQEQNELLQAKRRLRDVSTFKWNSALTRPPAGKRICEVRGFTLKRYNSRVANPEPLSLILTGSKRIQLRGANGSGKSTLLKAITGDDDALSRCEGEFFLGASHCLFDQRLTQFIGSELLWKWFQPRVEKDVSETRLLLGSLGFAQSEQEKPVSQLSGGEKIRLELALCVNRREPPQLLLLDEPTNHLDLESRRILLAFLKDFQGAMILVSHDSTFLNSLEVHEVMSI